MPKIPEEPIEGHWDSRTVDFDGVNDYIEIEGKIIKNIFNFIQAAQELRNSAEPFIHGETVTKTSGTEPLMDRLEKAIKAIDVLMKKRRVNKCQK